MIDEPADLTRFLEAKQRGGREFARLYGSEEERPLGMPNTPGMLQRIHRAVEALDDAPPAPTAPASAQAEAGLPLPGS